jgi:hypothetical protein
VCQQARVYREQLEDGFIPILPGIFFKSHARSFVKGFLASGRNDVSQSQGMSHAAAAASATRHPAACSRVTSRQPRPTRVQPVAAPCRNRADAPQPPPASATVLFARERRLTTPSPSCHRCLTRTTPTRRSTRPAPAAGARLADAPPHSRLAVTATVTTVPPACLADGRACCSCSAAACATAVAV